MSRRKKSGAAGRRPQPASPDKRREAAPTAAGPAAERAKAGADASAGRRRDTPAVGRERAARGPGLLAQVGLLAAIFVVVTLIAELAGAANLGVAIGVGQIAFTIALVTLLLRAP